MSSLEGVEDREDGGEQEAKCRDGDDDGPDFFAAAG